MDYIERIVEKCRAIRNERRNQYGDIEDNFSCIAKMWSAYKGTDFDDVDVAIMMALLKEARIASGHHVEDNWVDCINYLFIAGEKADERIEKE